VEGHTDSDGPTEHNQALSEQRASTVRSWLITYLGSTAEFTTIGYGEARPVVPNNTTENKARNRRCDITVTSTPLPGAGRVAPGWVTSQGRQRVQAQAVDVFSTEEPWVQACHT
jgi:hypothetical protein